MTVRSRKRPLVKTRRLTPPNSPLAVIDVGTNSALLLIMRREGDRLVSLHEESQTPRLGAGLAETGRIAQSSVDRLVRILRHYQRVSESFGANKIITAGTRVFRAARNTQTVIREVDRLTGLRIMVLSGAQEAKYSLAGALTGLPDLQNGVLVDVGGGSTELAHFRNRRLVRSTSVPIGAVVLAETTLRRFCQISDARLGKAREEVRGQFCHLAGEYRAPVGRIIAVGGTITTLAALDQRLKMYRPDRVHGYEMRIGAIGRHLKRFRQMRIAEIRQRIPFDPARASVLPAGTFAWVEVLNLLSAKGLTVSHRGLRWGVAEEFYRKSRR